jgi:hypothetical protein
MQPGYALIVIGFGSPEEHGEVLQRARERVSPAFEFATPMPYVALQKMLDEANAWGFHSYDKGCYIEDITEPVIAAMVEHVPRKTSPLSVVLLYRLDAAFSEVADEDTAFSGGRSPRYAVFVIGVCPAPEMLPAEREWVRGLWSALHPHAFSVGSYVNGSREWDDGEVESAYGADKFARLTAIKAKYDPDNVFRRANATLRPESTAV